MSALINDPILASIWNSIELELYKSRNRDLKHVDPVRRAALVVEESAEALKEALDFTRPHAEAVASRRRHMMTELIQTAAMSISVLRIMYKEEGIQ